MRVRRIAVLIDGAFFLKRLPKMVEPQLHETPKQVTETAQLMCRRYVQQISHLDEASALSDDDWLDHVYRLFYYDAAPFYGIVHHPVLNRRIDFSKSAVASFRNGLFDELRHARKFALRLGHVTKDSEWSISSRHTRHVLGIRKRLERFDAMVRQTAVGSPLSKMLRNELEAIVAEWHEIDESDVFLGLRQKGVDMRIGLDIASMALKGQVDTIVLVTGDSDFVPAAKLARREGVEFLLDPLWQRVSEELTEHVDGVLSAFPKPGRREEELIAA